jgi:hypothetical protein
VSSASVRNVPDRTGGAAPTWADADPARWLWQADLARIALRQEFEGGGLEGWQEGLRRR